MIDLAKKPVANPAGWEEIDRLRKALKQLVDRVQDVTRNAGYGSGMFEPEMAEARSALRNTAQVKP